MSVSISKPRPGFVAKKSLSEEMDYYFLGLTTIVIGLCGTLVGALLALIGDALGASDPVLWVLFAFGILLSMMTWVAAQEVLPRTRYKPLEFAFREQASAYTSFQALSREDQMLVLPAYNHLRSITEGMEYGALSNAHDIWKSTLVEIDKRRKLLTPAPVSPDDGDARTNLDAIRAGNKAMNNILEGYKGSDD